MGNYGRPTGGSSKLRLEKPDGTLLARCPTAAAARKTVKAFAGRVEERTVSDRVEFVREGVVVAVLIGPGKV